MGAKQPRRFRQRLRVYFRRFRIAILGSLLLWVLAVIYLSRSGLPEFLQRPLLAELHARGVDLEFRRIRPRFYRGLVADEVRFGHAHTNGVVTFRAHSADLRLDWSALLHRKIVIDRIAIHDGQLDFNVSSSNGPMRNFTASDIAAGLRLLPDDRWVLDDFRARFIGAQFNVSGEIQHASAMRQWELFQQHTPAPAGSLRERLQGFAAQLERISFGATPEFRLHFEGDGRDQQSFHARLTLQTPDAQTDWGRLTNALLSATLFPATGTSLARVSADLRAQKTITPWAEVSGFNLHLELGSETGVTNQLAARVQLRAVGVTTPYAQGTNLQFRASWQQSLRDPIPVAGEVELRVDAPASSLVGASQLQFRGVLSPNPKPVGTRSEWSWWTNLAPYQLDWQAEVTGVRAEKGDAQRVAMSGRWLAPLLVISNLHTDLKDGPVDGAARLDVDSREATFQATAAFDAQQLRPFLRERSRAWLTKFSWGAQPPLVTGSGAVILPSWTNREPDWREEVLPTLRLAAEITATNGAYLGIPADWAHTHVTYTNLVWWLPDFRAASGTGRLAMEHVADDRTRDYVFRIHSTLDPRLLRPLLTTNAQRGLDFLGFTENPVVRGEVWGRWRMLERIGARGTVALTNFSFRGQSMDSLTAELNYTNRVLDIFNPEVFRQQTQTLRAAGVQVNFDQWRAYFTNGFSTAEPLVIARCIGPKTGAGFEPYLFHQPPVVHVEGFAPLQTPGVADLRFEVAGGPFSWWRFNVPQIHGKVRWRGDSLALTDMRVAFYEGQAEGNAEFNFASEAGTDFRFFMNVTNANLRQLMPDLFSHTNHLEGRVSGLISITNANSADPHSWFGWTDFTLREGLIWEMPIFGLFSDVVSSVTPGWGRSRMSEASGRLGLTNSVVHFDNVEMRSALLRLQFRGKVDLAGNVDAIAEAEPLRDTPLLGPLVRLTLKPMTKFLEYKVTGTLGQPKKEPLYLGARMLFMPFRPIQTLDELFSNSATNAPVKQVGK